MKKTLAILILSLTLVLLMCGCKKLEKVPEASPIEDFTFKFQDGEAIITGYTGTSLEIVIPSVIEERPVTIIGEESFHEYDMKYIYIPDSVTTIEEGAFEECKMLASIHFPNSLTRIEDDAFSGCESLKGDLVFHNLTSLGDYAFSRCQNLRSVTISGPDMYVPEYCFRDCTNLEKVVLNDGIKSIGTSAFEGCSSLKDVQLADALYRIYGNAFHDCPNLTTLHLPSNVGFMYAYNSTDYFDSPFDDGINIVVEQGSNTHKNIAFGLYRLDGADYISGYISYNYRRIQINIEYK